MIFYRLLAATLLILSISCWAGPSSNSNKVYLKGGVCADDPFTIVQASATILGVGGQPKSEWFAFDEECEVVDKAEPTSFAPISFTCHPGGKTLLSGATYKKIKTDFINGDDVYTYKCVNGCALSPKIITYSWGDCG